jgi:hypothetical protein
MNGLRWWQWIPWITWLSWRVVCQVDAADLIPRHLPRRGVALAGPADHPTWVAFDCPCASGHRVMLNTDRHRRPYWRIVERKPLTVRPSVRYRGDTKCHFLITDGKVQWYNEAGYHT